jgi:putative nucleotidyltransferase with HDIG domain
MADKKRESPKWIQALQKNQSGKRLLIAFCVLLALALFIHFREVRVEILEVDSTAKHYVVAQVDFEFPDEEGTVILRQQAAQDIGAIYELSPKAIEKERFQFDHFLIHDQRWRTLLPHNTFEEIFQIGDEVKEILLKARFSDQRTLQRLKSLDLLKSNYSLLPEGFHEDSTVLPRSFWQEVQREILEKSHVAEPAIAYVLDHFQDVAWPLEKDTSAQRSLRKMVETTIPGKYRRIQAGSRILDQGEQVTSSHIAMIQSMKKAITDSYKRWSPLRLLSSFIFATIFTFLGAFYLRMSHQKIYFSVKKLALYATLIILLLFLSKITEFFLLRNATGLLEVVRYPLYIPFIAILITVLLNAELALFSIFILTITLGLCLAVDHGRFLISNFITGIVAILSCRSMRKRKEVFIVCGKIWIACFPLFFFYSFSEDTVWSVYIFSDLTSTLAFLVLTSILIVGLLPILESIFHIMTDITLMEYMDPNNELLRRLSIEAPGTYQHCLVVGSIAEAAAQAIGANGLFCRVSTLYHDIGKLSNPHYFTENQMGGFNIHQLLTPLESAQVIIAHVPDGELLGRKFGLPQGFIDIIREHHGNTLVYYFYCKQVEQAGGDIEAVEESQFRYPGPKPRTKESAIIMMADTVEAASRSLEEVSEESITELVNRLIGEKLEDGQFNSCELTFQEFETIKTTIIKNLAVARHIRIKYPEKPS